MISVRMATIELLKLQPSQRGALLIGLLVGIGTGALAGWQVGLGVGGAVTALPVVARIGLTLWPQSATSSA